MSVEGVRDLVDRLGASSRALAALGAAIQARIDATPPAPGLVVSLDDVLDALGVRHAVEQASPEALRPVLGAIRTELFLGAQLVAGDGAGLAWTPTDPVVLQAAGDASAGFPAMLDRVVAPQLDGLAERLGAAGAAFLDVGAGVGELAIAMARRWPSLLVVGVDPWAPAIALGRENVRAAGLADRIELRAQGGEALSEEGCFDLAWIPSLFISGDVLPRVLERTGRALRPGSWLLLAFATLGADPLAAALARLRTVVWGGTLATADEVEILLVGSGLVEVKILPGPPNLSVAMAAGRRPTK